MLARYCSAIFLYLYLAIFSCWVSANMHSPLTLKTFIHDLTTEHPLFAEQGLNKTIAKVQQQQTQGAQDWQLAVNSKYLDSYTDRQLTSQLSALRSSSVDTSISRLFWGTGGTLSLGYQAYHTNQQSKSYLQAFIPYTNYYGNKTYLQYKQPLLNNFGGKLAILDYDLAGYNIQINELHSNETKENFLLTQILHFYDLALYIAQDSLYQQRLELAQNELVRTQAKYQQSLVEEVDLLSQKSALANAKKLVANNKHFLLTTREKITQLLDKYQVISDLSPQVDFSSITAIEFGAKTIDERISELRLLKLIKLEQQSLSRQLEAAQESARAQLDLTMGLESLGEQNSMSDAFKEQQLQYSLVLEFRMAIGDRNNKNAIKKLQLGLEQNKYTYQHTLRNLLQATSSTYAELQSLKDLIALDKAHMQIAADKTAAEKLRYNNGHGDISFVINSQDSELAIKISYLQHVCAYYKNIAIYKSLIDQLLPTLSSASNNV